MYTIDMKNLKEITLKYSNLLNPPYDKIVLMDGFDALCALSQHFYGELHQLPSIRHICKPCIEQDVLDKHKTHKISDLSRKYGYAVRTLARWIAKLKKTP